MRVEVGGATLWVERDGDGPPVLMPTGAGVEFYRRTLSPPLRRRLGWHFVEMRGTGGSNGDLGGATFATLADDVEAVRVALGLGPVVVVGHSNHGCIALEHGLRHPAGNAGVVSVAGVLDGREAFAIGGARWEAEASEAQRHRLAASRADFAAIDAERMSPDERSIREYLSFAPLCWREPDLAWPSWGGFPGGAAAYFAWMRPAIAAFDATATLASIASPVLAVVGAADYVCPLETWAGAGASTRVRVERFERSAHNPQVEEQARFDEVLTAFVAGCATG